MGLTGFNRQRKQALSKAFGIDAVLADKLMSYGYSTPESVRKADELPFLSEDELTHLFRNDYEEDSGSSDETEKEAETATEPESEPETSPDDNSDEKEYPYHKGGGYYVLSSGEQVRGEDKANAAQDELNGG